MEDKLCEAMYQNNGFFFWTLADNVNSQIILKLRDIHELPLYLDVDRTSFDNVPQFLTYIKTHFDRHDLPYVFVESMYNDLYLSFLENFKLTLLDELERDPFTVIRANLVDYKTLNFDNVYDSYALNGGLLDRIFSHWQAVFEKSSNGEDLVMFLLRKDTSGSLFDIDGVRVLS